jgi:hypothetical protein
MRRDGIRGPIGEYEAREGEDKALKIRKLRIVGPA